MLKLSLASALCLSLAVLTGCSPKAEFPPETVQAYQADDTLRSSVLQKCADHAAQHIAFATASDTDECQKAAAAQSNVNYAAHMAREREANAKVAAEINQLAGAPPAPTKP
jgi:hypothetical protein